MFTHNLSVSIIMPVYNGAAFLVGAIENIRQQQYEPLEIIIIDDGSTDNTSRVIADLGKDIRYVYQTNQGPAAARNTGLKLATGELIAFLDVDDLWAKNRLSTQVDFLATHPEIDIVQGLIQDLELVRIPHDSPTFETNSEAYYSVNLGSALYRREVFDRVGLFDKTLHFNEDTDWFIRAWDNNIKKAQLAEVALLYRKHDGNMTNSNNSKQSGFVWLLKKRLDQHRKNGSLSGRSASGHSVSITEYIGWKK